MPQMIYFDCVIDPATGDLRRIGPLVRESPFQLKKRIEPVDAPAPNDPTSASFYEPKKELSDDAKEG